MKHLITALVASLSVTGALAHYCATQAFREADLSAVQPVKFLDLVWASLLGLVVSACSFLFGFYVLANKVLFGARVEGWAAVMLAVLFLGGVQLVMIGVLGEYLWRALDEARARPLYIVERTLGR